MSNWGVRGVLMIGAILAGLCVAPAARAVQLDPAGLGQVLIYPYYTANDGQQTVLSITNTSDVAQVMQFTFREALNGRSVMQFKVWLGPYDMWTGTVFALADGGIASEGAGILSRDRSCTTPMFATGSLTTGGAFYFPFRDDSYADALSDGGPAGLARTRDGWVEVIALSNLNGPIASAINFLSVGGTPANCGVVQNLASNAVGLSGRPSGGLLGSSSVVRAGSGSVLASRAEALSGFTEIKLYNDMTQPGPDLASVNEGTVGAAVSAKVIDSLGRWQALTYGQPGSGSRPIDAVSAALMASRTRNDYQANVATATATDWVVTLPTKPFYTDPAIIGAGNPALAPFEETFGSPGMSRVCAPYRLIDTDQKVSSGNISSCQPAPIFIPPAFYFLLFQSANVVGVVDSSSVPLQSGVLAAPQPAGTSSPFFPWHVRSVVGPAGWMDVNFAALDHRLPASAEGKVLSGLPVIGYSATTAGNSLYAGSALTTRSLPRNAYTARHASSVTCTKASDGMPCD